MADTCAYCGVELAAGEARQAIWGPEAPVHVGGPESCRVRALLRMSAILERLVARLPEPLARSAADLVLGPPK